MTILLHWHAAELCTFSSLRTLPGVIRSGMLLLVHMLIMYCRNVSLLLGHQCERWGRGARFILIYCILIILSFTGTVGGTFRHFFVPPGIAP